MTPPAAPRPRSLLRGLLLALLLLPAFVLGPGPVVGPTLLAPAQAGTTVGTTAGTTAGASVGTSVGATDQETVVEYYFGQECPVCAVAGPVLERLVADTPGARLVAHEVWHDPVARDQLAERGEAYNIEVTGVPVVLIGERAWIGFREGTTEAELETALRACTTDGCPDPSVVDLPEGRSGLTEVGELCGETHGQIGCAPAETETGQTLDLPLIGEISLGEQSLFVSTALIALVDGVNPCSLWVLTVLIALTLNSGSRRRTLVVGFTFITVTAAIYALFIAGLFTVFTVVSFAPWIRVLVALVALFFAAVNIKDYFWFKKGLSFTIADKDKPGIYRGMRKVMAQGDNLPALVGATAVLAAGVSLVEFGCTAGFPVLWTNILTAHDVGPGLFLALLLVYMLIYQLDEFLIFGTAVVTLRASRLQETQGRVLKLVGGMLMLVLALVMLFRPELMSGVTSSLAVFGIALGASALVLLVHRVLLPRITAGTPSSGA